MEEVRLVCFESHITFFFLSRDITLHANLYHNYPHELPNLNLASGGILHNDLHYRKKLRIALHAEPRRFARIWR